MDVRRLDLKELHQIREKQGLVGDTREGRENRLNIVARAGDGAGKELQGSPTKIARYRSVDYVREGPVVARGAQEGQKRSAHNPLAGESDILIVKVVGKSRVFIGDEISKTEKLEFFRRLFAGAQNAQIIELAPDGVCRMFKE